MKGRFLIIILNLIPMQKIVKIIALIVIAILIIWAVTSGKNKAVQEQTESATQSEQLDSDVQQP